MTQQELKDLYLEIGVDTSDLGCIMLEVDPLKVSDIVPEQELFFSESMKYAQGIISEWRAPHVTLLYGLMENGSLWRSQVDALLDGIDLSAVGITGVTTFDSEDEGIEYSCYVALVEVTNDLLNANNQLRKLPHIDGFPDYKPHITLFYAKRNEDIKAELLGQLNNRFGNKKVNVTGLKYD